MFRELKKKKSTSKNKKYEKGDKNPPSPHIKVIIFLVEAAHQISAAAGVADIEPTQNAS